MPGILLRFADLKSRNIVHSWPQLKRLRELEGFPPGRMLSPNCRVWLESEVVDWIMSRPVESPQPLRGAARACVEANAQGALKRGPGRPRKNPPIAAQPRAEPGVVKRRPGRPRKAEAAHPAGEG
jgi:hypothetical protein